MCGILGYVNGVIDKNTFESALNRLSHRGPDGYGIWQQNNVSLGHRRLAIIDTSDAAKQPMTVENRYTITFNGEIYNYLEIKKELSLKGINFTSNSDTEVLLNAYITWGPSCLTKLNGMWAFAIYDSLENTLFISRDRLGKKPLFYAHINGAFVFSSEMKGIYPFLDKMEINYPVAKLAMANSFSYETGQDCLINHIKRFPASSYAYYKPGKELTIERYWHALAHKPQVSKNYEEQQEQFRDLFFDACKLRMRSDVTIGTALSGGLDSSAVICAMAHINKVDNKHTQKDWQHAFVASFPGSSLDETAHAKTVTDFLNIEAHTLSIDPLKNLNDIYYQTYLFEELYYAPLMPFVQLYGNIKKNHVTVSIDGHGADELFAGYPFDMDAALIDALPNFGEFKDILKAINLTSGLPEDFDKKNKLKFALLNKYKFLRNFSKANNTVPKTDGLDYLNSTLYQSSFVSTLPTLLRNYDRYSMINSVEIRMPFLDYRLVEFAFALPYSSKVRNGFGKAIVRDALSKYMPQSIAYRKAKIGFNAPVHDWMHKELKSWINDTIHSQEFMHSTLIDSKATFEKINTALNSADRNFLHNSKVFEQLMPFIWEKSLSHAKH